MLGSVHDGAHTDVFTASRFLGGKGRRGLSLGLAQVWQVSGCGLRVDIHGGVYLVFNSQGGFLEYQLQIMAGRGHWPR